MAWDWLQCLFRYLTISATDWLMVANGMRLGLRFVRASRMNVSTSDGHDEEISDGSLHVTAKSVVG